ncbi:hypothetical protein BC629DRAFT_1434920 [Irpex lacteus]|nr:hypothetical protein BC629DRAFT_1434920 [Irpex lacteus]
MHKIEAQIVPKDVRPAKLFGETRSSRLGRKLGPDYYVMRDALRFRSLLESSDEDSEPEPGKENDTSSHCSHTSIPKYAPYSTANKLLYGTGALHELQLAEKSGWPSLSRYIRTNISRRELSKYSIPSDEDILKVQRWSGLDNREPGWWLSTKHYRPQIRRRQKVNGEQCHSHTQY